LKGFCELVLISGCQTSEARLSSGVEVDYTTVKNVKKPSGAKPGMVIYENYRTLVVTPDESRIKSMASQP
jgi:predicted ribosome quality control (RQC) complex YloA/Tae2 family protein